MSLSAGAETRQCFYMRSVILHICSSTIAKRATVFVSRNHEDALIQKLLSFFPFVLFERVPLTEQPHTFTSVHFTGSHFSVS